MTVDNEMLTITPDEIVTRFPPADQIESYYLRNRATAKL